MGMPDRYFVGQLFLNSGPSLEISRDEYDKALVAVNSLLHSIDAEEKYDGLIENFREFEDFMLGQAFQSLLSTYFDDNVRVQSGARNDVSQTVQLHGLCSIVPRFSRTTCPRNYE